MVDVAAGGFFDFFGLHFNYFGTTDFVVTSIADKYDHMGGADFRSLREAVDLANQTSGTSEIWVPAWEFLFTRDRASHSGGSLTDTDVSFGDLDISESAVIRGFYGQTAFRWEPGVVDKIFDLLGDYNGGRSVNHFDEDVWQAQVNSSGGWEEFSADGDDDGDVDQADHDLWLSMLGNTLDLHFM